jgi:membrane carboxypeptidase/penicillin-binding protein PbpC
VDLSALGAHEAVYWLINGELKRKTSPGEVFAHRFSLPGAYEITALDAYGNFDRVEIVVAN